MKKKVIKAQISIPHMNVDEVVSICKELDEFISDYDIYYDCFEATLSDEDIICFYVEIVANTFKECDKLYSYYKSTISNLFGLKPYEIIKMKLDRII